MDGKSFKYTMAFYIKTYNKAIKSLFATLSHWLQRKKAQQIVPALLTTYGGVNSLTEHGDKFN